WLAHHGAKGVNNNDGGVGLFNFPGDCLQDRAQVTLKNNLAEVDKTNGVGQLGGVEKSVLLLVSQHFYCGFTEHSEVESWTLRTRIGKHELVSQRRLAAPGGACDDVEREF